MNIAIIGAGNVGSAIATGSSKAGHAVTVTDTDPAKAQTVAQTAGAQSSADIASAAAGADVVVLAVPFQAVPDLIPTLGQAVQGKVVIDATNPLKADYSGLAVSDHSGAEDVQQQLTGARVVKAFNTVLAANQGVGSVDGTQLDGFYAGDDASAKQSVADLLTSLGFRPVDAGPLKAAQALEHLAFLNISLNAANGWSWQSGWKLVGPVG